MDRKKLGDVCILNRFPELDAATLSSLNTGIGNVKLLPSSKDYDWFSTEEVCSQYLCQGEVITLGRARYANIKYWKGKFVAANNVVVETYNPKELLGKYLYYFLLFNVKKFYVEGTTYPKFDANIFKNTYINIPLVEEQVAIVDMLDELSRNISDNEYEIARVNELINSRFIEMFEELPKTKISKFIRELRAGKSLAGTEPCKNKVLKTGAATFGFFDINQFKYLPKNYVPNPLHKVEQGDVIISRMNTPELVGSSSYVWDVPDDYYYPDRLWKTLLFEGYEPIFVWQCLQQPGVKKQIQSVATGTSGTMFNISKGLLKNLLVDRQPFSHTSGGFATCFACSYFW